MQAKFFFGEKEKIPVPPVPIPNTEVKPLRADGTTWVTVWESKGMDESLCEKRAIHEAHEGARRKNDNLIFGDIILNPVGIPISFRPANAVLLAPLSGDPLYAYQLFSMPCLRSASLNLRDVPFPAYGAKQVIGNLSVFDHGAENLHDGVIPVKVGSFALPLSKPPRIAPKIS